MVKLILPKTRIDSSEIKFPILFLAGPIRGGDDWQVDCFRKIQELNNNCTVAIPCRYDKAHPLYSFKQTSDLEDFSRQMLWERYYLDIAAHKGCIIFWLPNESKENPRQDGQPYARDTYGELGEWRAHLMHDSTIKLVIGAEDDFPGIDIIQRNFQAALGVDSIIHSTLTQTIEAALQQASEV